MKFISSTITVIIFGISFAGFSSIAKAEGGLCLISATDGAWFLAKSSTTDDACGIAAKKIIPSHTADQISYGTYSTEGGAKNSVKLICKGQPPKTVSHHGVGFVTELMDFLRNNQLKHCTMQMR